MICENCHGARYLAGRPCGSCGGTGLQHCCEGPAGNAADCPPERPASDPETLRRLIALRLRALSH